MIPTSYFLVLSAVLFAMGLIGVMVRRNVIIIMMCVELMLNAVNITFIALSRAWGEAAGQGIAFFIIALAAAEAAVGLAIVVAVVRSRRTVNADEITLMRN